MAIAKSVREARMRRLLRTAALPGDPVTSAAIAANNKMGKRLALLLLSMISNASLFCDLSRVLVCWYLSHSFRFVLLGRLPRLLGTLPANRAELFPRCRLAPRTIRPRSCAPHPCRAMWRDLENSILMPACAKMG